MSEGRKEYKLSHISHTKEGGKKKKKQHKNTEMNNSPTTPQTNG